MRNLLNLAFVTEVGADCHLAYTPMGFLFGFCAAAIVSSSANGLALYPPKPAQHGHPYIPLFSSCHHCCARRCRGRCPQPPTAPPARVPQPLRPPPPLRPSPAPHPPKTPRAPARRSTQACTAAALRAWRAPPAPPPPPPRRGPRRGPPRSPSCRPPRR